MIGSTYELIVPCLGNPAGTRGVVYEEYKIGLHSGISVIFSNGNFDGFNDEEQKSFLKKIGYCKSVSYYEFTNVLKLSNDFNIGYFKPAFM